MNSWKKLLGSLLLAALCLLPAGQCLAKEVATSFGSINLPDNAYLVEYDFKNDLESLEPRMRRDVEKFAHLLNVYVITSNDGDSYRTAVAIGFFFDNELLRQGRENLDEAQKERLSFRLHEGQREEIQRAQEMIKVNLDRLLYEGKNLADVKKMHKIAFDEKNLWTKNPTGLIDYEWSGLEPLRINGQYGYATKGRFAAYLIGILTSMYFEGYAYNIPDRGVGSLMLMCVDSEREYWAPIFAGTVTQSSL